MAKNLMTEILKMLGVEYGEIFKLREVDAETCENFKFKFVEEFGLVKVADDKFDLANDYLLALLQGNFEIIKLPWEPQEGDTYYCVNIFKKRIEAYQWIGFTGEYVLKLFGMVYRTKEEAKAHLAEDYENLTGKPWGSR